ncbi:matrix metalloproteinase-2 isoform X2 [Lingula anatina]|uniref:Matrix metalloproteinase-2 isoform X2 n=1 Tax=Lingula anatina TaxID=7574 RepID=A0A1S3IH52_LINAN|nr:matrix metalloproteinase-2 isoform X2 [Lingula anatina]|eukprot:XP_013397458.1 matrix metalloproteinase-2 isoform X2 [Lingula anatina]
MPAWLEFAGALLHFLLFLLVPARTSETHTADGIISNGNASVFHEGLQFLIRYGYLPSSDMESGRAELRTAEELGTIIRDFQQFAGLNKTGYLDEATIAQMKAPRCGVQDIRPGYRYSRRRRRRYILGPSKWKKRHLTYRFETYSNVMSDYLRTRDAITQALKHWEKVTTLRFTEQLSGEADIKIKFGKNYHGDGYPFDGRGGILAHAFFPGDDNGGDTHFDDDERWVTEEHQSGTDLFSVAVHEFGHALGLAHSDVRNAIMFPWYKKYNRPNFGFHSDDIEAISKLYGKVHPDVIPTVAPPTSPPVTQAPTTPKPRDKNSPPLTCDTTYDAIALIRGEIFIFKGKWFFWLKRPAEYYSKKPISTSMYWKGIPDGATINCAYERPQDKKLVFFSGNRYYVFNANQLVHGFPEEGRPITDYGLPNDIEKIDAVFTWSYNSRTYLITGNMYWKLDEKEQRVVPFDYPRDMGIWQGVPTPVDAAFQFWDGVTYFFKGDQYWQFNDELMKVEDQFPQPSAEKWMGCPLNSTRSETESNTKAPVGGGSSIYKLSIGPVILLFLTLHLFITKLR